MTPLTRLRAIQGAFLVADNAVRAVVEMAEAAAERHEASLLTEISVLEPDGYWFIAESGGETFTQWEIDDAWHAAACHAASAACYTSAARLAATPAKARERRVEVVA